MTVKETKSSEGLVTVLGVVGGLMGSALLGVLLNPPAVLQQPSTPGILGMCSNVTTTTNCQSLQTTFSTSASVSFSLVMLSVIMCLGVAMRFEAWLAPALVFFQLSLLGLAAALIATAWMLLPPKHAEVVTAFMALLVVGSLWALRPPFCMGWYMLWRRTGVTDTLHWTLRDWDSLPFHIVSRASMVRILLSCGANVNFVQHHTPLPLSPMEQEARATQLMQWLQSDSADHHRSAQALFARLWQEQQPARRWWKLSQSWLSSSPNGPSAADNTNEVAVTPLFRAVVNTLVQPGLVHLLLDEGASVQSKDLDGNTPLHLAVIWNRPKVVQLLLEHDANVNEPNCAGKTPWLMNHFVLQHARTNCDNGSMEAALKVREVLEAAGADSSEAAELGGDSLLFQAVASGDLNKVQREVLDAKEDVNSVGLRGEGKCFTPLMVASIGGYEPVVRFLLEQGADVELRSAAGCTALMLAAGAGQTGSVKLLLDYGADVNAAAIPPARGPSKAAGKTIDGVTPLWMAAKNGCTNVVSLLLEHYPTWRSRTGMGTHHSW